MPTPESVITSKSWWRDRFDQTTRQWIGWTLPPPDFAVADAGWDRDELGAWCHRCGDSVAIGEATESGCSTCRDGAELDGGIADGVFRLGTYTDDLMHWVQQIKYARWREMAEHLGRELGRQIMASNRVEPERAVVVPMPMPWPRRLYRGIDHAREIAQGVAAELHAPIVTLMRKQMQVPQVKLSPSERRRAGRRGLSIKRRFTLASSPNSILGWDLHDLHVILIDDVRTTGATLLGAARVLRRLKPAKIVCGVLAVSDSTARRKRSQQSSAAMAT